MIVIIDNYDSFVYNLVQYLGELGEEIYVYRNDKITVKDVRKINPSFLVISPGPCTPKESGISREIISSFAGEIPILGVCLGHQSIGEVFGGRVVRANSVVHGKTSKIYHDGKTIFCGIKYPFIATRYHSLIIEKETLPDCLVISARTEDGIIMGIRHKEFSIEGVQFHPESILTRVGKKILENFLKGA
jgi:anthranilate synthase/aminodeoxychorismate synthase-like glutamine amidotransferase